jgi:1,4-alpha-glucan branching enzyme
LVLLNLGYASHTGYRIGLPRAGWWREALNSDSEHYGGANLGNHGGVHSEETPWHSQPWSAEFNLPPLSCSVFLCE